MYVFLPPLQAGGHYVYRHCERQRVCVDLRMVYRCAVLYVRCFSFPFISFSFFLLLCARRHRTVPVCEGQQKTSRLGAVREGHSCSY